METLRALKLLGIMTALDDFGTGYSSLTSLERLPLSRVKLDRSVLAEVDSNPRAASIASSIIALCRSLGLQVEIEGLERTSQLAFLSACGDVSVQGYLVARPADASEILELAGRMGPRMRTLLEAAEGGRIGDTLVTTRTVPCVACDAGRTEGAEGAGVTVRSELLATSDRGLHPIALWIRKDSHIRSAHI